MNQRQLGAFGEKIAIKYLQGKGYKILDKNFFKKEVLGPRTGEVDIIAKKEDVISFVEVKTLRNLITLIEPEEKINFFKKKKLIKTAQAWLLKNRISLDAKWQIDIISIKIDLNTKRAKIRHFENAISQ